VSRYEKFGYGVMAAELASTTVGIRALHSCGFTTTLLNEVWRTTLDWVDYPVPQLPSSPDRLIHEKALGYLLKTASSFSSLAFLLDQTPATSLSPATSLLSVTPNGTMHGHSETDVRGREGDFEGVPLADVDHVPTLAALLRHLGVIDFSAEVAQLPNPSHVRAQMHAGGCPCHDVDVSLSGPLFSLLLRRSL